MCLTGATCLYPQLLELCRSQVNGKGSYEPLSWFFFTLREKIAKNLEEKLWSNILTCFVFCSAVPKDGGFSQWGKWTPCTATTCEGKQSRERSCDDPVPENDGKYCTGPVKEERACSVCVALPA